MLGTTAVRKIRYALACRTLVAIPIVAGLEACGGALGPPSGASIAQPAPLGRPGDVARALTTQRVARQTSWVTPQWRKELENPHRAKHKLIYASDDGYSEVEAYNYRTGALIGAATGFSFPYGQCSDKKGNVYVADFGSGTTYEIGAGGTSIVKSWATGGAPIGCSVNPLNGDLAVTLFDGGGGPSGSGGIWVFPAGGGSGKNYPGPGYDWPAGYDKDGNLFLECNNISPCSSPRLAELPAGGSQWIFPSFDGSITSAAAVEWDGKYLGVGDQQCISGMNTCIEQVSVSGSTATVVNTVELTQPSGSASFLQWAENARRPNGQTTSLARAIAAGDASTSATINIWPYPAGGNPSRQIVIVGKPYAFFAGYTIVRI